MNQKNIGQKFQIPVSVAECARSSVQTATVLIFLMKVQKELGVGMDAYF